MMFLRPAYTKDLHILVSMYKELLKEIHKDKKIGSDYFFYKCVISWIDRGFDIVIAEDKGEIIGFYLAYVEDNSGILESVYNVAELYIMPKYRKTKCFFIMQENIINISRLKKINLVCDSSIITENLYIKLGAKKSFSRFERGFNE